MAHCWKLRIRQERIVRLSAVFLILYLVSPATTSADATSGAIGLQDWQQAFPVAPLPPGHVRGDVVSHSYVPNRFWGRAESVGICPYLCEYGLMVHDDRAPLENFHAENIRRIDLASQWSTAIMLYARRERYADEIIHLMIRAYHRRQLIILRDYFRPDASEPLQPTRRILEKLWAHRDAPLSSPEGEQATGRQLINNILMVKLGDEHLGTYKTEGLEAMNRAFREAIPGWRLDGERPFGHIKSWHNLIHYGIGPYAASAEDLEKGKLMLPKDADCIGVDVYHYWDFAHTPFDPADPAIPPSRLRDHAVAWQNVITRYYPEGLRVSMGSDWAPQHRNDTHAMLQGLDLAGADRTMLFFIANSDHIAGSSYTTPIACMDAFYHSVKAGPWVGLSWWHFGEFQEGGAGARFPGTIQYIDKKLKHYTPDHPEGLPYPEETLERFRTELIASRMGMFRDVVYGQFAHLNGPAPAE